MAAIVDLGYLYSERSCGQNPRLAEVKAQASPPMTNLNLEPFPPRQSDTMESSLKLEKETLPTIVVAERHDGTIKSRTLRWWRAIPLSLIALYLLFIFRNPLPVSHNPLHCFKKHTIEERAVKILKDNPLIGLLCPHHFQREQPAHIAFQMATMIL
jgi:hypothetical protein